MYIYIFLIYRQYKSLISFYFIYMVQISLEKRLTQRYDIWYIIYIDADTILESFFVNSTSSNSRPIEHYTPALQSKMFTLSSSFL